MDQPFTSFSTDDAVTAQEEEGAYRHVLFEIVPGGTSYVVDGNLSSSAVPATVTVNPDGTTSIGYSEQTASTSVTFQGTLASDGTMQATVNVSQVGGTVASGAEYIGAGTGSFGFTVPITKVSPDDIPNPPTGSGSCGFTSQDGVWLTWTPPSSGPSPSGYDIYEFVSTVTPPLFYIGHVSGAGLTDNSPVTMGNDASLIGYLVYTIGPTGLDSLTALNITFDGVMPLSPPSCTAS